MDLSNLNVKELNKQELEETDGGIFFAACAIIGAACGLLAAAYGTAYYKGYHDAKENCS